MEIKFKSHKLLITIPVIILLFVVLIVGYNYTYQFFNKNEFHELQGILQEVVVLNGDYRKKRVMKVLVYNKEIKLLATLNAEETVYLKNYKGPIYIKYRNSPFSTIWIEIIKTKDKTFYRQ